MLAALARTIPKATLAGQVRTVVSGPPTVRMSFAEKAAFGLVMSASYLAIPAWVLVHIKDYRGES